MRKEIITLLLAGLALSTQAQEEKRPAGSGHSVCIHIGGGFHTHQYKVEGGERRPQPGGLAELRYQYVPNKWGFATGIQISSYQSHIRLNNTFGKETLHGDNNLNYQLNTRFVNWEESQNTWTIEIPISLLYSNYFSERWGIQFGLGATLIAPIKGKYQTLGGSHSTSGYFESTDVEYEDLNNHGFLTKEGEYSDALNNLKNCLGVHAELGLLRAMGKQSSFYMGLYLHYGVSNFIKPQGNPIFEQGEYNGLFKSDMVEKVKPFKAGIKLGFQFGISEKNEEDGPRSETAPITPKE